MGDSFTLWVPGKPKTKQRPRLGKGKRAFTPVETVEEEKRIAAAWALAQGTIFRGPVYVEVDYYKDGQEITVSEVDWTSPLRGDVDNYLKLTMDALQRAGAALQDDKKVMALHGVKHEGDRPT